MPADAPPTRSLIECHVGDVADTLGMIATTLRKVADLTTEGGESVEARRQPFLRFVTRVNSEGYQVADNLAITDTTNWPGTTSIRRTSHCYGRTVPGGSVCIHRVQMLNGKGSTARTMVSHN